MTGRSRRGTNGVGLAARYAFPPNRLRYCGQPAFISALRSGRRRELERELKKFTAHYGYLCLIAAENGLEPFDMRVVRAFWTGNSLLENVSTAALRRFIVRMIKDRARAGKLVENLPPGALPHHSFNPLYLNFVTEKVARSVRNYDSCCVSWGRVLGLRGKSATVLRNRIARESGRFVLRQKADAVALEKCGIRLVGPLKKGDVVSVHWGVAIERLGPAQSAALERYTRKNLDAINSTLK
jgi:hypothetical protein